MKRYFTYLFAIALFLVCIFNERLIPENISDRFLGVVKRNIKKDKQELLADMKEITRQGLIYFEVYDGSGELVTVLKEPQDFDQDAMKGFGTNNFSIKSVSKHSLIGQLQLTNTLP